jgi:hypothetical protein
MTSIYRRRAIYVRLRDRAENVSAWKRAGH